MRRQPGIPLSRPDKIQDRPRGAEGGSFGALPQTAHGFVEIGDLPRGGVLVGQQRCDGIGDGLRPAALLPSQRSRAPQD